jgi:hypothetical protein
MTDAQKLLVASLVVTGLVLAYNLLNWTSQFGHDDWTPIVIFTEPMTRLAISLTGVSTLSMASQASSSARLCRFAYLLGRHTSPFG